MGIVRDPLEHVAAGTAAAGRRDHEPSQAGAEDGRRPLRSPALARAPQDLRELGVQGHHAFFGVAALRGLEGLIVMRDSNDSAVGLVRAPMQARSPAGIY
ncbi:MAG: hypothetical protein WCE62_14900 [Polyangiales bacterium]